MYRGRSGNVSQEDDEFKFGDHDVRQAAIAFGDGSQSRFKTQEADDDDQSEFDVVDAADRLNSNAISISFAIDQLCWNLQFTPLFDPCSTVFFFY